MPRSQVTAFALLTVLTAACSAPAPAGGAGQASAGPSATESAGASAPASQSASPPPTPTPTPDALAWGPTREQWRRARELVDAMTVREQAGQVLMPRFSGATAPAALVRELHLGGVILFEENLESAQQTRRLTRALQEAAGRPYPLAVAVDQEGGAVARVGPPATELPTFMSLGAAGDADLAVRAARASGLELRALGFTTVFAPVADVTSGPDDPTIGSRSAGSDPQLAGRVVAGALRGYAQAGILAVPKHFPGHGSVPADSHRTLPVQRATRAQLRDRDLVPFAAAVAAGASAVMVAHVDVRSVDPGVPSSLSAKVVDGLLRDELGFDGLVVSDAQDMGALTGAYGSGEAAVRSLLAGVDVVLAPLDVRAAHAAIVGAVRDGRLPAARLEQAAARGVALALRQQAGPAAPGLDVLGSHDEVSYDVSSAAATVVSGPCSGRLVGDAVRVQGGTERDRARFAAAATDAGLSVGSGDLVTLLGGPTAAGGGDVVVALDAPYGLGRSTARTAAIALYGRTPQAFRALLDVLTGRAPARGRLPVEVPGADRPGC